MKHAAQMVSWIVLVSVTSLQAEAMQVKHAAQMFSWIVLEVSVTSLQAEAM